ncbi:hypothetical protein ASE35_12205 [Lysobacter sp. Root916]|uniref:DUF6519 domain-containing protein n=1 Tax=Lysobacter sp. Root916 TaxID=1736606 RepID=UPI00070E6A15|nr:DUF6519 domain-containing protein [Lysobacter sp. Root916]KRD34454.1 hypothetical protein ASE35_12205 [Lysobacter sp. Root916]
MAIISPNTFDPIRRYVSVRLAQGVPLADADWNEGDDMRRYELRAFLRWFVGDGVPVGNDGFRIAAINSATSFTIVAGGGPQPLQAGRMLVDGMEAFITADIGFSAQPLHAGQAGAAALAASWGVPVIAALPAPPVAPATRTLTVYLDVWERLVTLAEDPALVLPGLGTETCSRLRREWAVRVRTGAAPPVNGDPDFIAGHSYAALATITQTSAGIIDAPAVVDRRRRGISLPSQMDFNQVLSDTFGGGYSVNGSGVPQLPYPMRDVINAMLRERPAAVGPTTVLNAGPYNTPTAVIDSSGVPWVFWVRVNGPNRFLSFSRRIAGVWTPPADAFQFTGVLSVSSLAAAAQSNGTIRVFYSALSGNNRIFSRAFTGAWGPEELVDSIDQNSQVSAVTDQTGTIIVVWRRDTAGVFTAQSVRYPLGGAAGAVTNAGTMVRPGDHAITIDPTGAPQLVYVQEPNPTGPNWSVFTKRFIANAWEANFTDSTLTVPVTTFIDLAAGYTADGSLWLFYSTVSAPGFSTLRARRLVLGVTETRELLPPQQTARFPSLAVDAAGNAGLYIQNGALLQQVGLVQHI